jgi:hypothetical protein
MEAVWDGLTRPKNISEESLRTRGELADAARSYDWPRVIGILSVHKDLVNSTRPGGLSLYAPLHQAAHGGASAEVILRLIELGAWRTLQNARGERPIDVAEKRGFTDLASILAPEMSRRVPLGVLLTIQAHFHAVIRGRADKQVQEHDLRLPELEPLLEFEDLRIWFPVPGMYGGFAYRLVAEGVGAKLVSDSWTRVVEGSGERHEITSAGSQLVEKGFV